MEWGRMSSSWGINRTMAQLHALLIASDQDLTMDEMIDQLHISRGNASMNLRDLTEWGVIQRYRRPGDRKDIYRADDDIVQMFSHVVRERKRREIDPTVSAIRDCLALIPADDQSETANTLRRRLTILLEIFDILDRVFTEIFHSDETIRHTMDTLTLPNQTQNSSDPSS
jgi:DNA-binding transcriptional regulator GbsR (MarR family)